LYYPLIHPKTGADVWPNENRVWAYEYDTYLRHVREGRLWWGANGELEKPRLKSYLDEVNAGIVPNTIWFRSGVGDTQDAKREILTIFGKNTFETPKPTKLIKQIIKIAGDGNCIVLDSFAGSGTSAQAVLELNKEDGGKRKFILVECEDYANEVTAERVRRVLKGVKNARDENLKRGMGGSFTYCTLGQELNVETLLKGERLPDFPTLARYVFYTATGQTLGKVAAKPGKDFYIGETDMYRVHLVYKPDREFLRSGASALNSELVKRIAGGNKSKKKALVFATAKYMGQRELSERRIEFAQLPYAIYRVLGD
jgi:adenine-specific DNA-methyltransferase